MELINNSQILGSGSTDLILNTRGKIYVKVGDRFYELNFKNEGNDKGQSIINNTTINNPEQDLSPYVTKKYLKAALGEYITKRNWEDIMQTKEALENAQLDEFTESIAPITVNTMQMIVGTRNLQFDFINSLTDDAKVSPGLYINESGQLVCPKSVIKHYTLFGPESVKPNTSIKYYARWTIQGEDGEGYTLLNLDEEDKPYYIYLRVPTTNFDSYTDEFVAEHITEDPKGQYIGNWFASIESHAIDELEGYAYLLVALVTGSNSEGRSIGYLNGFTEILPGQITAYVFKTADGNQYLDFLNERFKIGDDDEYMKWDKTNGLEIKGKISVVGGDLQNTLENLQAQIDDEVQCWFSTDTTDGNSFDIPLPNEENPNTTPNWPASRWDTESKQKEHLGDLYYVVENNPNTEKDETGLAYRYVKRDNNYYWVRVLDNSVSLALYNAYIAQKTADDANKVLDNIANDNIITIQEHKQLKDLYDSVISQYNQMISTALLYISDEPSDIKTAKDNLDESKINLSNKVEEVLNQSTDYIITDEYKNAWDDFFRKMQSLSEEITKASQNEISAAAALGNNALNKFSEWANDNNISAVEIDSILDEGRFIESDYNDIYYRASKFPSFTEGGEFEEIWNNYKSAYIEYSSNLKSISDQWDNRGNKDFISLNSEFVASWKNSITNYYNSRKSLLEKLADLNDVSSLAYLKEALQNGKTTISGGLILSSLIALGFGIEDPNSSNYYNTFQIMSGINGVLKPDSETNEFNFEDPAIWFGGSMEDIERGGRINRILLTYTTGEGGNNIYTKYNYKEDQSQAISLYVWTNYEDENEFFYKKTNSTESIDDFIDKDYSSVVPALSFITTEVLTLTYLYPDLTTYRTETLAYKENTTIDGNAYQSYISINPPEYGERIYLHSPSEGWKVQTSSGVEDIIDTGQISRFPGGNWLVFNWGPNKYKLYKETNDSSIINFYGWEDESGKIIYTTDNFPSSNSIIYSEPFIKQEGVYIKYALDDFAKSLFRMDGSGYLANGNITWNRNGDITMNNINVQSGNVGPIEFTENEVSIHDIFKVRRSSIEASKPLIFRGMPWDTEAISIKDAFDTTTLSVRTTPLSTESVPTYVKRSDAATLLYGKGSVLGGTITIQNDLWMPILEPQYIKSGATYTITNFELEVDLARISSPITCEIYLIECNKENKALINGSKTLMGTWTWASGSISKLYTLNDLTNKKITVSYSLGLQGVKYGLFLCLKAGGQVKSGVASNSHIRFYVTENNSAEITFTDSSDSIDAGTFIGPNGISSIYGKNTKFQWMVPSYESFSSLNKDEDPRSTGGWFTVEMPIDKNNTNQLGIRMVGFKSANNQEQNSPGIDINLGNGWKRLKTKSINNTDVLTLENI